MVREVFGVLKRLEKALPYDPALPFLGIHQREIKKSLHGILHENVQSGVLESSSKWKQLQCPSTDKQINQMWTIKTMEHYGAIKRTKN